MKKELKFIQVHERDYQELKTRNLEQKREIELLLVQYR